MTQLKQFMVVVTGYDLIPQVKKTRLKLLILVIIFLAIFLIVHSNTINTIVNDQIYTKIQAVSSEYEVLSKIVSEEEEKLKTFFYTFTFGLWFLMSFCSWILLNIILRPVSNMVKERDQFIHNARHELRTPLTILQSELELFDTSELSPTSKMDIFGIKQQVTRLIELSQNLLNNLNTKESLIKIDNVQLNELIKRTNSQINTIYVCKSIILVNNIPDLTLVTNQTLFTQLLTNVIENIYKHGSKNSNYSVDYSEMDNSLTFRNSVSTEENDSKHKGIGIIASKSLAEKLNYSIVSEFINDQEFRTKIFL